MATIYHELDTPAFEPPALTVAIEDERLSIAEGYWPDCGTFVQVMDAEIVLKSEDRAVLIRRTGRQLCEVVVAADMLPYGIMPLGGGRFRVLEHVDLLAWREGDDWHVKRLIQGGH